LVFYETSPRLIDALAIGRFCPPRGGGGARIDQDVRGMPSGTPDELIAITPQSAERRNRAAGGASGGAGGQHGGCRRLLRAELRDAKPSQAAAAVAKATGLDRKRFTLWRSP
jgi:16S rRNA (cytidine1402-2'-O)-methyltransferase